MKKINMLAIGVHPDDVELSAVGTLLKHKAQGYTIGICDLTGGELGTRGSKELRLKEAARSGEIMQTDYRSNLHMQDGFMQAEEKNIIKLAREIRRCQPDVVLTNAIYDRHPDHGRAAKFVSDTCFYSGLSKIEIKDEDDKLLAPWRPQAVYHYIQDREMKPDLVVDISDHMEQKMECILAFSSQFNASDDDENQTPISGKDFMEFIYAKNRVYGRNIGAQYAEAFTVERPIGVENLIGLR